MFYLDLPENSTPTRKASTMKNDLAVAITLARQCPGSAEGVHAIYSDLAGEIALQKPLCVMSGRCCHFETYGHRLYVTTLELATFASANISPIPNGFTGPGCPFQKNRLCTVHEARPFGCRIYFCDTTADAWQKSAYEQFHARLKRLHDTLDIPYFYVEWREGLKSLATVESGENIPSD